MLPDSEFDDDELERVKGKREGCERKQDKNER